MASASAACGATGPGVDLAYPAIALSLTEDGLRSLPRRFKAASAASDFMRANPSTAASASSGSVSTSPTSLSKRPIILDTFQDPASFAVRILMPSRSLSSNASISAIDMSGLRLPRSEASNKASRIAGPPGPPSRSMRIAASNTIARTESSPSFPINSRAGNVASSETPPAFQRSTNGERASG